MFEDHCVPQNIFSGQWLPHVCLIQMGALCSARYTKLLMMWKLKIKSIETAETEVIGFSINATTLADKLIMKLDHFFSVWVISLVVLSCSITVKSPIQPSVSGYFMCFNLPFGHIAGILNLDRVTNKIVIPWICFNKGSKETHICHKNPSSTVYQTTHKYYLKILLCFLCICVCTCAMVYVYRLKNNLQGLLPCGF